MNFSAELAGRVRRVQQALEAEGLDALYVSNPKNVLYLSGKEAGRVLLTKKRAYLWVRDLYINLYSSLFESKKYPLDINVYSNDGVVRKVKSLKCRRIGIENVNLAFYNRLHKSFKAKLKPVSIIEETRAVKTEYELIQIQKAAAIARMAMEKARRVVKPGIRELDAVAEIEGFIRKMGSETPPFNDGMLLSSGSRAADVHAHATLNRIKRGPVIVDLGARWNGYHSDMTRTLAAGRLTQQESEMVEFVQNLKRDAIDFIKPGMEARKVQEFIESEMKKKNLTFYHAAGHGVGLEIHEKPSLGSESTDTFKIGMVFTIEPGVYLPGKFGVRFEDMMVVKKNGLRILT
jgi:Xaa-Pro aminopeptidase